MRTCFLLTTLLLLVTIGLRRQFHAAVAAFTVLRDVSQQSVLSGVSWLGLVIRFPATQRRVYF